MTLRGRSDLRLVENRSEPFNQFDARMMPGNLRLAARCVAGDLAPQPHEKGLIARLRQLADEIEQGTVSLNGTTPTPSQTTPGVSPLGTGGGPA